MDIIKKFTSRKFLAALAGVIVGLVVAFGGEAETIKEVAGSALSVVTAVTYILAEAGVDKKNVAASEVQNND